MATFEFRKACTCASFIVDELKNTSSEMMLPAWNSEPDRAFASVDGAQTTRSATKAAIALTATPGFTLFHPTVPTTPHARPGPRPPKVVGARRETAATCAGGKFLN